jgi:hypothetical protein
VGTPSRTPITQSPQAIPRTSQLSQSMIISCSLVGRVVPDTADVRSTLRQFFTTECRSDDRNGGWEGQTRASLPSRTADGTE